MLNVPEGKSSKKAFSINLDDVWSHSCNATLLLLQTILRTLPLSLSLPFPPFFFFLNERLIHVSCYGSGTSCRKMQNTKCDILKKKKQKKKRSEPVSSVNRQPTVSRRWGTTLQSSQLLPPPPC